MDAIMDSTCLLFIASLFKPISQFEDINLQDDDDEINAANEIAILPGIHHLHM